MKKKRSSLILGFASLLVFVPSLLRAQAVYTATRSSRMEAGAGVLLLSPDYVNKDIEGISGWFDYDFKRWLGVEVTVHLGSVITPNDLAENSYLVGPRFLYHRRKFTVNAKLLFGRADLVYQGPSPKAATFPYNVYAFGGGLEYRISHKWNIRCVDFELQQWPNFEPNTLSPLLITIGASYIIK